MDFSSTDFIVDHEKTVCILEVAMTSWTTAFRRPWCFVDIGGVGSGVGWGGVEWSGVGWGGACTNVHVNLLMKDMLLCGCRHCACIHGWGGVGWGGDMLGHCNFAFIRHARYCKFVFKLCIHASCHTVSCLDMLTTVAAIHASKFSWTLHSYVMPRSCCASVSSLELCIHTSCYATVSSLELCIRTSCYATVSSLELCIHTSCYATVISLELSTHTSCYATVSSLELSTHTSCYATVISLELSTHMSCYATVSSLELCIHTSCHATVSSLELCTLQWRNVCLCCRCRLENPDPQRFLEELEALLWPKDD